MFIQLLVFFFFKQKTAYEITYGDWSSDVCSSDLTRSPPLWFAAGCAMTDGPAAPPHLKSKRDAGSARKGSADRRNRATTVSPCRFVKFTKNRPVVALSGANARPRSPCSPPETTADERS